MVSCEQRCWTNKTKVPTQSKKVKPNFQEKPQIKSGWINGGFFVFNKSIFDYLDDDKTILEKDPLESLSKASELRAYKHKGFWQCMDTKRDKDLLNELYLSGEVPWNSKEIIV